MAPQNRHFRILVNLNGSKDQQGFRTHILTGRESLVTDFRTHETPRTTNLSHDFRHTFWPITPESGGLPVLAHRRLADRMILRLFRTYPHRTKMARTHAHRYALPSTTSKTQPMDPYMPHVSTFPALHAWHIGHFVLIMLRVCRCGSRRVGVLFSVFP